MQVSSAHDVHRVQSQLTGPRIVGRVWRVGQPLSRGDCREMVGSRRVRASASEELTGIRPDVDRTAVSRCKQTL